MLRLKLPLVYRHVQGDSVLRVRLTAKNEESGLLDDFGRLPPGHRQGSVLYQEP